MPFRHFFRAALLFAACIAIAHAGPVFYAISYADNPVFGTIDPTTGVMAPIGPVGPGYAHDITVSPTGAVYAITGNTLYSVDKGTGIFTSIGALPSVLPTDSQSLAFRSDGVLFMTTVTDLYTVDPGTANATQIGSLGGLSADNIRFGPAGLYMMTAETNSRLFLLDQNTAAQTFIGSSGLDDISLGAHFGGVFLASNAPGGNPFMVTVNPATGAGTEGAPSDRIYLFALDPTSVPEPSTWSMLVAGGLMLAWRRRR